jgi:predicted transcriptional regulator
MSNYRTVSFRIAEEKVAELDQLAKNMDRDRSYLLNEAIDGYLDMQRRFLAQIERGMEDIRQGRVVDHDEVMAMLEARIGQKNHEKRRKTA